jgi:putative ABC transport system permease protein
MKFFLLIFKSLLRNRLRTALTCVAVMILVLVVTFIWSILSFLDLVTAERAKDFKAIVTEKWQIPSQMPMTYYRPLSRGAARTSQDERPQDAMSWQFYGGSTEKDRDKRTIENIIFFFCMDPRKLRTMMDDLQDLDPKLVEKLARDDRAVIVGRDRLRKLNKRVGDTFLVYSMNYAGIDLEFKIAGLFPEGRYDDAAVMNMAYLQRALDDYEKKNGKKHPLADKTLNLVWLRVPDSKAFGRIAEQIENSVEFKDKPVRCETASSGVASFLDAYRDLIWGMRYLLSPALLVSMALVIANAISISVRERRTEMAVLKVLGFRPWQILSLILGEALLLGIVSGLLTTSLAYWYINVVRGGFKFPIAFFPAFMISPNALWWGVAIGAGTALAGSLLPAWSARSVKVSEVFAKVA